MKTQNGKTTTESQQVTETEMEHTIMGCMPLEVLPRPMKAWRDWDVLVVARKHFRPLYLQGFRDGANSAIVALELAAERIPFIFGDDSELGNDGEYHPTGKRVLFLRLKDGRDNLVRTFKAAMENPHVPTKTKDAIKTAYARAHARTAIAWEKIEVGQDEVDDAVAIPANAIRDAKKDYEAVADERFGVIGEDGVLRTPESLKRYDG